MSDNYIDMMNKLARKKQLKQSKAMLQQILRVYESTMKQYMREWVNASKKHGPNGTASIKLKYAYMLQLHAKILAIQEEYGIKASSTYNDLAIILFGDKAEFENTKKYAEFSSLLEDIADIGNQEYLEMMYSGGIYKDGKGLSDRLWSAVSDSGEKIQDEIMKCISQGMASKDVYKHLAKFAISGNAAYNAMRLARTTYCHMSQLSAIHAQRLNPYIGGIKWHSVHSVGKTCDECKERDGKVYKPKELPFDHPNGMCYMEEVLMIDGKEASPVDIAKDLKKWLNDEPNSGIMDKWYKQSKETIKTPKQSTQKARKVVKATKRTVTKKEFMDLGRADAKAWSNDWIAKGKYGKLSKSEKEHIRNYTGSNYRTMNTFLRKGVFESDSEYKNKDDLIKGINEVVKGLDKLKADRDILVHRGAPISIIEKALPYDKFENMYEKLLMGEISNEELTKDLSGIKLKDKGFMSTSVTKSSTFGGDLQFHIEVPKGSNAGGFVNGISRYKDSEYEFLLKPDTEVVIKSAQGTDEGKLHIYCEIVEK